MNQVITAEQAKKITGGRTPLVPVQYEAAVKALQECVTLDDAKVWSDKADALAAWAKIYRNDEAGRKAKQLKLHAYRRMGELAKELRPGGHIATGQGNVRKLDGPVSLLVENGLKKASAVHAHFLAKIPQGAFNDLLERSKPPSPLTAHAQGKQSRTSKAWRIISGHPGEGLVDGALGKFVRFCSHHAAQSLSRALLPEEIALARKMATEALEWLDEFERHLPKPTKEQ